MTRVVTMRNEVTTSSAGQDVRSLWASINAAGDLVIHGQDLGPGVPPVLSDDSEYEWYSTHRQQDLPALRVVLGVPAGADLLDVIRERFWEVSRCPQTLLDDVSLEPGPGMSRSTTS